MYPIFSLRMQPSIGLQMIMAGHLLRASAEEIEQLLLCELAENPALELSPGRRSGTGDAALAFDTLESQAARQTAIEQLEAQAALLVDQADQDVLLNLLHLLDGHGYLREPAEKIARQLGVDPERVRRVIGLLHQLEPPGVGARDLRECLLIQCAHLQADGVECSLPKRLLEEAWDDLTGQRWTRAARKVGASTAEVEAASRFIARSLYPYPLRMLRSRQEPGDILSAPDLVVHQLQTGSGPLYGLELPGEAAFRLRLSRAFKLSPVDKLALSSEEREWISARIERARLFIASLEQRWITLRRIGEYLIAYQADFLTYGPRCLRPITRAAVAQQLGMHESTVSRAVSDKTVLLPNRRLIPLRDLFDASLPVKEALRKLLAESAAPLSDREIAECLKTEGLVVARRTIGKYREQLRIPNRHLRQAY